MRGQHFFFATRDDLVPGIEYVESGGLPAGFGDEYNPFLEGTDGRDGDGNGSLLPTSDGDGEE